MEWDWTYDFTQSCYLGPGATVCGQGNWRLQEFTLTAGGTSGSTPYLGSPAQIPGTIEAENYDNGGEGVAYRQESQNLGGAYRLTEGVDLTAITDNGSSVNALGYTHAGEWLLYTVNVQTAGAYTLGIRTSSVGGGGTYHFEMDGANISGSLTVPGTGGNLTFTTVTQPVALSAGQHVLKLVFDMNDPSGYDGNFNWFLFSNGSVTPSPTPTPTPSSSGGPYSVTNQQPVTQPFYPNTLWTTKLPSTVMSHLYANSDAIVKNVFHNSDNMNGSSFTVQCPAIQLPSGSTCSSSSSLGGFYYASQSDPIYKVIATTAYCAGGPNATSANCPTGKYIHAPAGAWYDAHSPTVQDDYEIFIWDQSTDIDPTPGGRLIADYWSGTGIKRLNPSCACTTKSCADVTAACQLTFTAAAINFPYSDPKALGGRDHKRRFCRRFWHGSRTGVNARTNQPRSRSGHSLRCHQRFPGISRQQRHTPLRIRQHAAKCRQFVLY